MEMTVYAPLGMLGYGFPEHSLRRAMDLPLSVIAVDAGSTDPGAYYLGSGKSFTSRNMVKRDLSLILQAALAKKVPLIIGSSGGAGGRVHLQWLLDILQEIVNENGYHFRLAIINAEMEKAFVAKKVMENKIIDFEKGTPLTVQDVWESERIVAQMGVEPIIEALNQGADVVIAGRAYDAALLAAVPIMRGYDPGLAYHMGKILECGSFIAEPRESDGALAYLKDDHFIVEPADVNKRTSEALVAAHTFYEKSNPLLLELPGGSLDLTHAKYEAIDERRVKVSGSKFHKADKYYIKLEGAKLLGYRSICIAGARDPHFIQNMQTVEEQVRRKISRDLNGIVDPTSYQLLFTVYGKTGVMGEREPETAFKGHEVCILIEVLAETQETAELICALARSATLHMQYPNRLANAGNIALRYTPAEFPIPPAYVFNIYHLMEIEDPCSPFDIEIRQI